MTLILCGICGEVVDSARLQLCPGCGSFLKSSDVVSQPEPPVAPRSAASARPPYAPPQGSPYQPMPLQIPQARQETRRDGSFAAAVLAVLGVVLLIPFILALTEMAGLPIAVGLLISAVAFAGTVVLVVKMMQPGGPAPAGPNPYAASSAYRSQRNASAVRVVSSVAMGILMAIGIMIVTAALIVVGFVVFLYIVCMG